MSQILNVKSLHIYPIKSARAVDLKTAEVKPRGLAGDRRFMLVDAGGGFITQRKIPKLAQLSVRQHADGIAIRWPSGDWLNIAYPTANSRQHVTVWRDTVNAALANDAVNKGLSAWLDRPVRLVFMDDKSERQANPKWTPAPSQVSFADGYPILITNTASLTPVNEHITSKGGSALDMNRFRPNIVIDCEIPWVEANWKTIQIGDVIIDLVKPCARCIMTSIDQTTGEKNKKTALSALKHLNPSADPDNPGVIFGINAVPRTLGKIRIGDKVKIS